MPEKDFREKRFEDFNDVFADIINVLLFHGERRVLEDALETGMSRTAYKVEGTFDEQERDTKKYWNNGQLRIAIFGLENQTGQDPDCIFRCIGYDGAEYWDQVRRRSEIRRINTKRRKEAGRADETELIPVPDYYPVITLILYFGESRWSGSLHMKDHMSIPEGLENLVPDYTVSICEIAYLTDEQIRLFRSDFRYVADYFAGSRKRKEGIQPEFIYPALDHIRHVKEFSELMNAITNTQRFSKLPDLAVKRGSETMWTIFFDEAEARGEARGKALGKEEGRIERTIEIYYYEMHLSPSEIIGKIIGKFSLTQDQAVRYVEETLNLQMA